MSKYIDADKLKTWLENEADMEFKKTEENANSPVLCHFHNGCRMQALDTIDFITSLQQEEPDQTKCVWIHKKYNREYRIVSDNARLKDSDGKWIDCVIYAPLYENEFEMFAREKDSFYKEFEKKIKKYEIH